MTIFFQNSKFHRPIGLRGSKCVIVPNFAKIGRIIVEIWRFSDFRPPAYIFNKYSAGAEMGDRLATIDMSLKVRLCPPFFLGGGAAASPSSTVWPRPRPIHPYQVAC